MDDSQSSCSSAALSLRLSLDEMFRHAESGRKIDDRGFMRAFLRLQAREYSLNGDRAAVIQDLEKMIEETIVFANRKGVPLELGLTMCQYIIPLTLLIEDFRLLPQEAAENARSGPP